MVGKWFVENIGQACIDGSSPLICDFDEEIVFINQPTNTVLRVADIQVSEAAGTAVVDVTLSQPSGSPVTVDYLTVDVSANAGSDYDLSAGTLTFTPGVTSQSIIIPIIQDTDIEGAEVFNVTLSNAINASATDSGAVTILDDDSMGGGACGDPGYDRNTERELFIWQDCAGDGTWYVRATSGGGSVLNYSGNLTTDQSFSNVVNFSVESSDTVNTSNPQVISFNLTMGSVWHDGFNFKVPSGSTCLTLDTPPGITVKVGANRTPVSSAFNIETLGSCGGGGQPTLSVGDAQVSESAGTATVTVTLSQPSSTTVSVNYQTEDDSALVVSDYGLTSGVLTFNSGDTSKTIPIPIVDDMDAEGTESFNVQLSNPTNAAIADATGVVTIQDDDSMGGSACGDPVYDRNTERELFIWQDCAGDGTWYVRATSGGGSVLTYSGNLTTDQSFSNVVNFSVESSDTVNTSNPQVISFNLTMGSVWHDGFNFKVPSGSTCLTLDTPPGITVKVGANRTPVSSAFNIETLGSCGGGGQPTLSVGDAQVSETAGTATVTVALSQSSSSSVTVNYQTADGSANAVSDYGTSSGTLTFNPGTTSQTVPIPIVNDMDAEGTESFNVQLSNPTNAAIADATGVVTIQDDDSMGGSACGDPGFDRTTERELFIWQDCAGDGTWYLRATAGGGSVLTYTGNLTTNQNFSNVENVSIESRDTVDISNPQVISFNFVMGSVWFDGFNFNVPTGNTCLTLNAPAGITVKVGENRTPVSSAFDIETLGSCQ